MTKATSSTEFRKLDVDKYFEDQYEDDVQDRTQQPNQSEEISKLLSQGKNAEALRIILKNAPLGSKNTQLKDSMYTLAIRAMLGIKVNQLDDVLGTLDKENLDILMKYVYRGFENPSEGSSGHLLNWHEKITSICGVGAVVRAMTDKMTV